MAGLFGRNRLRTFARNCTIADVDAKLALIESWRHDYHHGSLRADKETSREQSFNRDFFLRILGYVEKPESPYSFEPKATTAFRQLPDAVLSYTDPDKGIHSVAAVVELKGASVQLDRPQQREGNLSPVQQAFKYKTQYRVCPFVLVSNFYEIRLYADNQLDYERWTLDDLTDPADDYQSFRTFYALLCREHLTSARGISRTEALLSDIRTEQDEIGKKFYAEYKLARLDLLRDIYRQNPKIRDSFHIGIEKAQKIVDRVVFACFAEDRGLLPDNTIARVVAEADRSSFSSSLWATFRSFFEALNLGSEKLDIPIGYNGGLFARDPLLDAMEISDAPLRAVADLSRHDFVEELSVNILGHIFEQSISDLEEIREKTASPDGIDELDRVRKKVGKRKKEGVFYTPDFAINYIVDRTLGEFLRSHEERLKDKHRLTENILDVNYQKRQRLAYLEYQTILQDVVVCDPACGSGAFLVAAFDYLLSENRRVDDILGGSLVSTEDYVRSILRNNLFGVDVNEESVQITKLSLWLKTAEKGKALTTLDANIRCGNSLVSSHGADLDGYFNWEEEFPRIFARGGFDVIVGNPPYVRVQNLEHAVVDYLFKNYTTPVGKLDISIVFFERALELLQPNGRMSFISSSQWMQTDYGRKLRGLLKTGYLREIVDFGSLPVFEDASTYPAIFTLSKQPASETAYARVRSTKEFSDTSLHALVRTPVTFPEMNSEPWQFGEYNLTAALRNQGIDYVPLSRAATAYYGNVTGLDSAFVLTAAEAEAKKLEPELLIPYALRGGEIFRYGCVEPANVVVFPYLEGSEGECLLIEESELRTRFPCVYGHLVEFKEKLQERKDSRKRYAAGKDWFKHVRPGSFAITNPPKLMVKGIDRRPQVGLLTGRSNFNGANCPGIVLENSRFSQNYILGILNSTLCAYYLNSVCPPKLNNTYRYNANNLNKVPIVGSSDQQLESFVADMLSHHAELHAAASRFRTLVYEEFDLDLWPNRLSEWWKFSFTELVKGLKVSATIAKKDEFRDVWKKYQTICADLEEEIVRLDRQIDNCVYRIYGLSDVDIDIVESQITGSAENA